MGYQKIKVPASGDKITVNADLSLNVPDNPIIPFIEGDGIGFDISPVMIKVVDAAVEGSAGECRAKAQHATLEADFDQRRPLSRQITLPD